ncbi:MAG: hypothetical protein R2744_12015 [Bacteroidales bacterium]
MLGEYFYKEYDYMQSQVYYDSATFLSDDYPGYPESCDRAINLKSWQATSAQ